VSTRPSRRIAQAQETKRLILDAALSLFTRRGYGATSVNEIADEAGVAVPTVYASVGTKPELLRLLLDRVDEQAQVAEHVARVLGAENPTAILAAQIALTRALVERAGPIIVALRSAAGVEPELATAYGEGMERHRAGTRATVQRIAATGALRDGVSAERAVAVLATLTRPVTWESLTGDFGWSFDDAQAWLTAVAARELLPPAPGAVGGSR
jgi:AcrR family transcriptional regulator